MVPAPEKMTVYLGRLNLPPVKQLAHRSRQYRQVPNRMEHLGSYQVIIVFVKGAVYNSNTCKNTSLELFFCYLGKRKALELLQRRIAESTANSSNYI